MLEILGNIALGAIFVVVMIPVLVAVFLAAVAIIGLIGFGLLYLTVPIWYKFFK